jgi:hypothetical protein
MVSFYSWWWAHFGIDDRKEVIIFRCCQFVLQNLFLKFPPGFALGGWWVFATAARTDALALF